MRQEKWLCLLGNARISTTQSKFDGSSAYFDGTGGFLDLSNNNALNFENKNLTIEGWIYPSGSGSPLINCQASTNFLNLYLDNSSSARLILNGSNRITGIALTPNTWQHLAIVREGLTWTVYVDGQASGTPYTMGADSYYDCSTSCYLGGFPSGHFFTGYTDEVRITKGIARYTSNFTPPTDPFIYLFDPYLSSVVCLLRCNGNNNSVIFSDESLKNSITNNGCIISTTQSKFGGSSGYFDGVNDHLILSNTTDLNMGSSSFTIECWFYPLSFADYQTLFIQRIISATGYVPIYFTIMANGKLTLWMSANNANWGLVDNQSTSNTLTLNVWNHIALVRDVNNIYMFINGVLGFSTTISGSLMAPPSNVYIGGNYYGYIHGYLDEVRITKGIGRYTSNFTPPNDAFPQFKPINHFLRSVNVYTYIANPLDPISTKIYYDAGVTGSSIYDGGSWRVEGTVTYNGSPGARKVSLFTLKDKRLIEEVWSDPSTGAYSFVNLKDQEYFVWSEDYMRVFTPASHHITDQTNLVFTEQSRFDPDLFVGDGKIWGTVLNEINEPLSRRLLLLEDQTHIIVRKTTSDPMTGYYEFDGLNPSKTFTVVCESNRPVSSYNDIIRARVQPEII